MLDPEEQDRLREMEDWIIKNEGTWVLAEGFNGFLGKVLHDKALPSEARVAMLRLLAYGAAQVGASSAHSALSPDLASSAHSEVCLFLLG